MNPEMPKDLQRWEQTRQRGKLKFMLFNGVLCWGMPMFAVMTFVLNRGGDKPPTPALIAISALIWTLGGLLFGFSIWTLSERRYQKFLAGQSKDNPS